MPAVRRPRTAVRRRPAPRPKPGVPPSLRVERQLLREGHRYVAAVDEVGRGALAGPVTVGVVIVDLETKSAPSGVRDSKLLTPEARTKMAPKLRRWAPLHAVGHADPGEIDEIGIIAALRLAGCRALAALPVVADCALLDGNHNWLSIPAPKTPDSYDEPLFALEPVPVSHEVRADVIPPRVVTRIKADLSCAAVAAASVLAKVERDAIMVSLAREHPEYSWELNKGYSAPEHSAALRRFGPSPLHRCSWNLPGNGIALPGGTESFDLESLGDGAELVLEQEFPEADGVADGEDLDAALDAGEVEAGFCADLDAGQALDLTADGLVDAEVRGA
jgi:ribonuclease HII